jgi:hypothetical protein
LAKTVSARCGALARGTGLGADTEAGAATVALALEEVDRGRVRSKF